MIETLISSSVLIGLICLLRAVLRGRISPRLQYGLWGIAAARLVIPWLYPLKELFDRWNTRLSVMNAAQTVREQVIAGTAAEYLADNLETGHVYHFGEETVGFVEKAAGVDWQLWIAVIWILGFLILLGWMIAVNLRFDRMLKKRRMPYTGVLPEFVNRPVWLVEGLPSPCYEGLGSYEAIYLPAELAEDQEKVRHALAHETGHVLQHDRGWGTVRCVLLCYYWVNPFVWAAVILSKRDCELACDERAIELLGEEERFAYGKTLVGLIASQRMAHDLLSTATTMAAGKRTVKERIRILARAPRTTGIMLGTVFAAALLLVACTFSGAKETSSLISVEGWEAAVPIEGGEPDGDVDGASAGKNGGTGDEELRPIGEGDELVLIGQKQWGNYHELTFRRQDRETGEALSMEELGELDKYLDLFDKKEETGIEEFMGFPMRGWGMSSGESRSEVRVQFWNVENAGSVRFSIAEGERELSCSVEIQIEEPVQFYKMNQLLPVVGLDEDALVLQDMIVYSNAVWLRLGRIKRKDDSEPENRRVVLQVERPDGVSEFIEPRTSSCDENELHCLFAFSEDMFPGAKIRVMAVRDRAVPHMDSEAEQVNDPELEQTIRGFVEAYMSGDMEKAARYSTITDLDPSDVMAELEGGSHGLTIMPEVKQGSETERKSERVYASYRFISAEETDSYSYLSMTAKQVDGAWKVIEAGFEK